MLQRKQQYFAGLLKLIEIIGGKFISLNYINSPTIHTYECHLKHRWNVRPADITRGTWCPSCAGLLKKIFL